MKRYALAAGLAAPILAGCAPSSLWCRPAELPPPTQAEPVAPAEPAAAAPAESPVIQTTPLADATAAPVAAPDPEPAPVPASEPAAVAAAEPAAVPFAPEPAPPFDPAAPLATVGSLQPPAWLERAGARTPLQPGDTLAAGDRALTGRGGRAQLKLADGATLTLGGDARLEFAAPQARGAEGGLVAGLKLLRGSALYAAGAAPAAPPDLGIGLEAASALRAQGQRFLLRTGRQGVLCNLGHELSVVRAGGEPLHAQRPNRCHDLARLAAGKPAPAREDARLKKWIAATQFRLDGSIQIAGGGWAASVAAVRDAAEAEPHLRKLGSAGYAAAVLPMPAGHPQYAARVVVPRFASLDDARRFAREAAPRLGFRGAWPLEAAP